MLVTDFSLIVSFISNATVPLVNKALSNGPFINEVTQFRPWSPLCHTKMAVWLGPINMMSHKCIPLKCVTSWCMYRQSLVKLPDIKKHYSSNVNVFMQLMLDFQMQITFTLRKTKYKGAFNGWMKWSKINKMFVQHFIEVFFWVFAGF